MELFEKYLLMVSNSDEKSASFLINRINNFVNKYGVVELINYLEQYQKDVPFEDYKKFQKIRKISTEVWGIPVADLNASNLHSEAKSTRMIISYLTDRYTNINREQIILMIGIKRRTIAKYLDEIKYRFENTRQYPVFCKNLELIRDKLDFILD